MIFEGVVGGWVVVSTMGWIIEVKSGMTAARSVGLESSGRSESSGSDS